jgi:hypothetical protein
MKGLTKDKIRTIHIYREQNTGTGEYQYLLLYVMCGIFLSVDILNFKGKELDK